MRGQRLKIKTVPIEAISFDQANVRKHGDKNIAAIKASLKRFGQQKPIIVDGNLIVRAGNGTLQAATELGWREINVVESDLGAAELTAFAIADNRTAELAEWDMGALAKQLAALDSEGFDYDTLGFEFPNDHENNPARGNEGLTDPDAVPEVTEPTVKRGEIWQLGKHRLMCGDSTSKDDVDRLMGGEKADMVFTDPPYGMFLNPDFSKGMTLKGGVPMKGGHSTMGHRGLKHEKVKGDHEDFKPELISSVLLLDAREIFLFGADYYSELLPERNQGSWIIWDKRVRADGVAIKQAMTTSEFETCWSKKKHQRLVCRMVHSGICSIENDKRQHPTQKPVKLAEWFFERWGKADDLVADLFLGSGSTLIACEKTNRRCFGMEIDPHYCDVIIKRWEDFTGAKAVRL